MKYTKTVPYFKKGDKIDKAARKLPKKQKEAVLKVSSAQKEQERKDKLSSVGAGFKKPTAKVEEPKTSQASKIKPVEKKPEKPVAKTRDEAFAQVRKANKKEFIWEGNPYHTRTAEEEEEAKRKANEGKTSKDKTNEGKTSAEVEQSTSSTVNSGSTTSARNPEIENLSDNSIVGWTRDGNTVDAAVGLPELVITSSSPTKSRFSGSRVNTMSTGENTERETAETVPPSVINSVVPKKPFYIPIASEFVEGATNAIYPYARDAGWLGGKFLEGATNAIYPYARDTGYIGKKFVEGARSAFQPLGRDLNWIGGGIKGVLETPTPNKQQNLGIGYGSGRSYRKQGGTINKFQRGNVLTNREQHLVDVSRLPKLSVPQVWGRKLFGTGPKPVETGRTHLNKAGEQVPEVGNRVIMPGGRDNTTITRGTNYGSGWLTSQRNIQRGDTTYLTPGGNAPSAADLPRYKRVFDNADKAIWGSKGYQQGGQVEQQPQMTEEDLVIDFTVRYFSALGVAPEDIMDQQGSLNPAYVEEITNVFQQGDIDWKSYMASPDEYIQQFVGARMQMAKKGAKLKRLSQLRIYKK